MLDVAYKTTTRVNYVTSQENFKEVYDRTKKCAFVEFRPIKRVLNTIWPIGDIPVIFRQPMKLTHSFICFLPKPPTTRNKSRIGRLSLRIHSIYHKKKEKPWTLDSKMYWMISSAIYLSCHDLSFQQTTIQSAENGRISQFLVSISTVSCFWRTPKLEISQRKAASWAQHADPYAWCRSICLFRPWNIGVHALGRHWKRTHPSKSKRLIILALRLLELTDPFFM